MNYEFSLLSKEQVNVLSEKAYFIMDHNSGDEFSDFENFATGWDLALMIVKSKDKDKKVYYVTNRNGSTYYFTLFFFGSKKSIIAKIKKAAKTKLTY